MRLRTLLACAALWGAAGGLAGADPPPTAAPTVKAEPFRPVPALLGTWRDPQGHLLPPGVSPLEAVHSALTLAPDGGFTLTVEKAAGPLRQSGTYTARGDRLTLSFPFGPVAYGFSRTGERLVLRPPGAGAEITLISAGPVAASIGPAMPAAGPRPHGQRPNLSVACSTPVAVAASAPVDPRVALQADYDALYADARHKDVQAGLRYFARDFTSEDKADRPADQSPSMDRSELQQVVSEYVRSSQSIRGHAVIVRLVVRGSEATVTVRHHAVVTARAEKGRHWRGVFDAVTEDTWVRGGEGWQMRTGRGLSLRVQRSES